MVATPITNKAPGYCEYHGNRGHFTYATIEVIMTNKNKSKRSHRKTSANQKLAMMFKMSREELATRKMTGAGVHQTNPRHSPRSEQKRQAILDQLDK